MPIPALSLPALSSLTGGGALTPSSAAGPAVSGRQTFGGINFTSGPSTLELVLIGAAAVGVFLALRK